MSVPLCPNRPQSYIDARAEPWASRGEKKAASLLGGERSGRGSYVAGDFVRDLLRQLRRSPDFFTYRTHFFRPADILRLHIEAAA